MTRAHTFFDALKGRGQRPRFAKCKTSPGRRVRAVTGSETHSAHV